MFRRYLNRICVLACAGIWFAFSLISAQAQDAPPPSADLINSPDDLPGAKEIYRQSCNSVVRIETADSLGSTLVTGFFVDDNGLIATVISTNRNPSSINVTWQERTYPAELLAIDQRTRLALIKIDARMTPALMLSRGLDCAIGSQLFAVSDTADALKRVSSGRLAGRESTLQKNALPTTILRLHMSATPDAFGAPVLDADGKVAAILLLNFDEENEVCFALPSEILHKAWADYQKFGRVEPAWCGFTLELGTTTPKIIFVQAGSPAAAAGFRPGDVIVRIGDRSMQDYQDVVDRCYYLRAGEDIDIAVLRGKSDRTLTLKPKAVSELKPKEK